MAESVICHSPILRIVPCRDRRRGYTVVIVVARNDKTIIVKTQYCKITIGKEEKPNATE